MLAQQYKARTREQGTCAVLLKHGYSSLLYVSMIWSKTIICNLFKVKTIQSFFNKYEDLPRWLHAHSVLTLR